MVIDIKRSFMWSVIILSSLAMLLVALFKFFWLSMGSLALDGEPIPRIYLIELVLAPAYLVSAGTAWKWPWIAEGVACLTLLAIFSKFIPWTISPFQRELSFEYVFVVAANIAFIAKMALRRIKMKSA